MKLILCCLVVSSLVGLSASASASAKTKAKGKDAVAPAATARPSAPATSGEPTAAAAERAMSAAPAQFEEAALYTITTSVGGEDYALTFIVPPDVSANTKTTNPSKSRVELQKPNGGPEQIWQPHPLGTKPPTFLLYSRVSDQEKNLTGILITNNPDNRLIDDDNYYAKYNRLTVSYNNGSVNEHWYVVKLDNGKYKIMSAVGHPEHLNKSGDSFPTKWNESHWLEAVKVDGKLKLRHRKAADTSGQEWTFTKVGTFFRG